MKKQKFVVEEPKLEVKVEKERRKSSTSNKSATGHLTAEELKRKQQRLRNATMMLKQEQQKVKEEKKKMKIKKKRINYKTKYKL